jgi:hypothetical protein
MSYSSWQSEQFDAELKELVKEGTEAGIPWMADSLLEAALELYARGRDRATAFDEMIKDLHDYKNDYRNEMRLQAEAARWRNRIKHHVWKARFRLNRALVKITGNPNALFWI